jgi:hypothetical protein
METARAAAAAEHIATTMALLEKHQRRECWLWFVDGLRRFGGATEADTQAINAKVRQRLLALGVHSPGTA